MILIKGMEMPKPGAYTCELGVLDDNTAVLTIYTPINEPQKSYTLIPVPPHGDLIDRDELEYHADNVRDPMGRTEKTVMWKKIKAAPTIIEAEV